MIIRIYDAGPHLKVQNVNNVVRLMDGGVVISVPGPQGPPGDGLPEGGQIGQMLRKDSNTDYSTEWFTPGSFVNKNYWQGTQSEYDAIVTKDPNTVYYIL